jgi:hypothetical protein
MRDLTSNPQINISKIPIGGGLGGAIIALSMVLVILVGIPVVVVRGSRSHRFRLRRRDGSSFHPA